MRKDSFRYLALDEPCEGDLVGEEVRLDEVPPLRAHDVGGLQVGRREVQEDGGEDVGHVQPEQVVELHRREDIPLLLLLPLDLQDLYLLFSSRCHAFSHAKEDETR